MPHRAGGATVEAHPESTKAADGTAGNMRRTLSWMMGILIVVLVVGGARPAMAQQQEVPEAVQRELERQGLTVEEARQQARQLGIDLSNPQQAMRRARQLGVPEARIQALLQAVESGDGSAARQISGRRGRGTLPRLAGSPTIRPDTLRVNRLPQSIRVEVPLRNENADLIQGVDPFFLTASGDTAFVENVQRVSGSVIDGVWGGDYTVEDDIATGTWPLFVRVSAADSSRILRTQEELVIATEREMRRDDEQRREQRTAPLDYFGYNTFDEVPASFQPSAVGPVDAGYIVGPGDELRLTLWGGTDLQRDLEVDREGRVYIPEIGQFTVTGKRLDELRREMRTWLSQDFAGLAADPPTIYMDLTVTRVRPVQVFVLGEVAQPGGYTISSYATVFNALYSVGGPLQRGSLRNIKIIREGDVVGTVDLYNYLLRGGDTDPVQLQSNDYIFIPPRGKTVAIEGAVKRPAYFEMKPGETVSDLLEYAGGLNPEAYTKRFQIERIVPFEERTEAASVARRVLDVDLDVVRSGERAVRLADGDRVRILSIMDARERAVTAQIDAASIGGAVFQPGRYEIGGGLRTVRDLIERADGLTGDAYRTRAQLFRLNDDLEDAVRSLDLNAVLADEPTANIVLQPGDSLHVSSVRQLEAVRSVEITGQVRDPGRFIYREDMTVGDLLFMAGGLTDEEYLKDVFKERADLYREGEEGRTERVIPFHLGEALNGEGFADEPLQPGDQIRIYPIDVEVIRDRFVQISGAVKEPGEYPYRDNLTLKDLILQAEGFTEGASLRAVEVTRRPAEDERQARAATLEVPLAGTHTDEPVNFAMSDTSAALAAARAFELQHRDRVFVRMDPNFQPQETVTLRGEVQFPGEYTLLEDNETLSDVVQRAGGIRATAYPKGGRLFRDDEQVIIEMGRAVQGVAENDVILQPNDEIFIPSEPNTVAVRGNVANEGLIKFQAGERVSYYLDRAGGALDDTENIFLTQASGATFKVKTGWFRVTPKVDDGAIIRVTQEPPPPPDREGADVGQIVRDVTGILSSALTVIVLALRAFE